MTSIEGWIMTKRLVGLFASISVLILVMAAPAAGVTHGVPDGDQHPHVGLVVFDVDDAPAWRCSGTLLSPTVMLTAGHCTFGTSGARVWFEPEVTDPEYPFGGGTSIEAAAIHTHPEYVDEAFFLRDAGVVILSEPVDSPRYGELPEVGVLDALATRRGLQQQQFTPVGYGLQSVVPTLQADLERYHATVGLVDVKGTAGIPRGTAVMFTSNAGKKNTGGTCFGDSGGPVFFRGTDVIAAVTSFGLNLNCVGVGGGYRMDTTDDQAFVTQFLQSD
jgi:secreted trypsin-like serine protease